MRGWWAKLRLGFVLYARYMMIRPMWPSIKGKLQALAAEDPEVAAFAAEVELMVKQADKIL